METVKVSIRSEYIKIVASYTGKLYRKDKKQATMNKNYTNTTLSKIKQTQNHPWCKDSTIILPQDL